jgi:hypothetical protein
MTQQEVFVALNLLANGTMFVSLLVMIIFLFVKADSVVKDFPIVTSWLIKLGLCIMCAGALFAFLKELEDLHHSIAVWQQLLRNIGNSIILGWYVYFHSKYFLNTKESKKPIKKAIKKPIKKIKKK